MRAHGDCLHFRPYINPDTGRVCPSQAGRCAAMDAWLAKWPKEWPWSFLDHCDQIPRPPAASAVWTRGNASGCLFYRPKPTKPPRTTGPTAALEGLLADAGAEIVDAKVKE